MKPTGLFIALEGGEGAGKSTQAKMLATALRRKGVDVVLTREPGATVVGSAIRSLIFLPGEEGLAPRAELLLYAADRAQHVEKVLMPALLADKVVITDRYIGSTRAYQGGGRRLSHHLVEQTIHIASEGLTPHLTFFLDGNPERLLSRAKGRGDANRFEDEELDFHHRVRESFRQQSQDKTWETVDVVFQDEYRVHHQVLERAVEECRWFGHLPKEDH